MFPVFHFFIFSKTRLTGRHDDLVSALFFIFVVKALSIGTIHDTNTYHTYLYVDWIPNTLSLASISLAISTVRSVWYYSYLLLYSVAAVLLYVTQNRARPRNARNINSSVLCLFSPGIKWYHIRPFSSEQVGCGRRAPPCTRESGKPNSQTPAQSDGRLYSLRFATAARNIQEEEEEEVPCGWETVDTG